jgi:RNA polymerase-associated protein LEO1
MRDLFGSDSEGEQPPLTTQPAQSDEGHPLAACPEDAAQAHMRDLFGSDDEDDEGDEEKDVNDQRPDDQTNPRAATSPSPAPAYYDKDGDNVQQFAEPMRIQVPFQDIPLASQLSLARLSNIIAIEPRPFDPDTFEPEQTEYIDERGNKRIRLADANAVRWRWAPGSDGGLVRQSNARIVRWSDGSTTLSVGEEVFDARDIDISGEHSFLYVRHPSAIQSQGRLLKKTVFRPATLSSGTHKRLAAVVDRQHVRQQRVRATTTVVDPKKEKEEREKAEEMRIRDKEKLAEKQAKQLRKYTTIPSAPRAGGGGGYAKHRALTAGYLEEEEDMEEEEEDLQDDDWLVRDEEEEEEEDGEAEEVEGVASEGEYSGGDAEEGGEGAKRKSVKEREAGVPGTQGVQRGEEGEVERGGAVDDDEAARRLMAAKASAPPPPSAAGRVLEESDEEGIQGEEKKETMVDMEEKEQVRKGKKPEKRKRAVVMESDSE